MNDSCSKFRRKSLNIVIAILRGLRDGLYPSLVARRLGLKRNLIHYYITKLEKLGFVEKHRSVKGDRVKTRGAITLYRLTGNGSRFLAEIEKEVFCRWLRLHNCYWLFPIVEQPRIEIDWHRVELHNWGQLIGRELGLTVRKNPNSIEVVSSVLYGINAYELLFKSRDEAERLASHLEQKFGMKLGRPRLSRKPHFGVYDPLASKWAENFQLSTKYGKIDESEGHGEIDWTDPVSATNYLSMPNRLERIEKSLEAFSEGMHEHMLLIHELREVVSVLRDTIKKK